MKCNYQSIVHHDVTNHIRVAHKKESNVFATFHCPFGGYVGSTKKYVMLHIFMHHRDRFDVKLQVKKSCPYKKCDFVGDFASDIKEHILRGRKTNDGTFPKHPLMPTLKKYKDIYKCFDPFCLRENEEKKQFVFRSKYSSQLMEHYMYRHFDKRNVDFSKSAKYYECQETADQAGTTKKGKKKKQTKKNTKETADQPAGTKNGKKNQVAKDNTK